MAPARGLSADVHHRARGLSAARRPSGASRRRVHRVPAAVGVTLPSSGRSGFDDVAAVDEPHSDVRSRVAERGLRGSDGSRRSPLRRTSSECARVLEEDRDWVSHPPGPGDMPTPDVAMAVRDVPSPPRRPGRMRLRSAEPRRRARRRPRGRGTSACVGAADRGAGAAFESRFRLRMLDEGRARNVSPAMAPSPSRVSCRRRLIGHEVDGAVHAMLAPGRRVDALAARVRRARFQPPESGLAARGLSPGAAQPRMSTARRSSSTVSRSALALERPAPAPPAPADRRAGDDGAAVGLALGRRRSRGRAGRLSSTATWRVAGAAAKVTSAVSS